jgi:hypothetical protein
LSPIRIFVTSENNAQFDVAFVQNWKRAEYSTRACSYKYRSGGYQDPYTYAVEDIRTIFRPVHMTPQWEEDDELLMYLNSKTDIHAWMNFY